MSTEFRRAPVDEEINKLYRIIRSGYTDLVSHYNKEAGKLIKPDEEQQRLLDDLEHYMTEFRDNDVCNHLQDAYDEIMSQVKYTNAFKHNIKLHSEQELYAYHADELTHGPAKNIKKIADSYIEGLALTFEMAFNTWKDELLSEQED